MAYRELINVATGAKGQIDAIITALDLHENPPTELEDLTMKLEQAVQLCDTIVSKGEDEPEEQPPAAPTEPAPPASEPATDPAAEDPFALAPVFTDPKPAK